MRVMPRAVLLTVVGGMFVLGACSSGQDGESTAGPSAGDPTSPEQTEAPDTPSDDGATGPDETVTDGDGAEPAPTAAPEDSPTDGSDVEIPQYSDIDDLMENLAAEQGVDVTEVDLIDSGPVTWSDGSLGCPDPDQMYTQALVDGSRVVLAIGGTEYHFHAGPDGDLFYCDHPTNPVGSEVATE
jgi:hypothetical protein